MYNVVRSWNSPSFSGMAIWTTMIAETSTTCTNAANTIARGFFALLCGIVSGRSSNILTVLDGASRTT